MTEQSRRMLLRWLESERWLPSTDFDDRLIEVFSKIGAMMDDEQARVFWNVSPVLVALTDERNLIVPIDHGEKAVMVFTALMASMDEDELTFHVADAVARIVVGQTPEIDREPGALVAEWGFRRGAQPPSY